MNFKLTAASPDTALIVVCKTDCRHTIEVKEPKTSREFGEVMAMIGDAFHPWRDSIKMVVYITSDHATTYSTPGEALKALGLEG